MHGWINLTALWQIVVASLLAGAGLPALVAVGLRALSPPAPVGGSTSRPAVAAGPRGIAVAAACFGVVLAAIGYGIYLIVSSGH